MAKPFEELANLDRLVHDPARLSILTVLQAIHSADFLFLQKMTGMTAGNLSGHLSKLEEGGLVKAEKQFLGKRPHTLIQLTAKGRSAIDQHWKHLEALRKGAQNWKSE